MNRTSLDRARPAFGQPGRDICVQQLLKEEISNPYITKLLAAKAYQALLPEAVLQDLASTLGSCVDELLVRLLRQARPDPVHKYLALNHAGLFTTNFDLCLEDSSAQFVAHLHGTIAKPESLQNRMYRLGKTAIPECLEMSGLPALHFDGPCEAIWASQSFFNGATVAVERQTILLLPSKTSRIAFCIFNNWSHRLLYAVASTSVRKYRFRPSQSHPLLKLTAARPKWNEVECGGVLIELRVRVSARNNDLTGERFLSSFPLIEKLLETLCESLASAESF